MEAAELSARVKELRWHHSIDLGDGVVTPGFGHRLPQLEQSLPDFTGKSVLDIGAWDGYYSFLAERRGAARVVALDHYAWGVDLAARNVYWDRCAAEGTMPDHGRDETEFWRPELPGKQPFDLAREVLRSRVETVVGDFMTIDLNRLGKFDIVLYLGVLYHMREPLTALTRLRAVTREVAVIETAAIAVAGHEDEALLAFYPGKELNGDFGNWFVPSEAALTGMCRSAGFRRPETRARPSATRAEGRLPRLRRALQASPAGSREALNHYRTIVHAVP